MRLDDGTATRVLQVYQTTDLNEPPDKLDPPTNPPVSNTFKPFADATDDDSILFIFSKVSNTDHLPADLRELLPAAREPLPADYNLPPVPEWLDIERAKKGQAFALKYQYGLNYADTLSLLFLFSSPDGLKPLIYTEKSHTPLLARKRYLSTVLRVKSWYETEIWKSTSKGYKNLKCVRALHLNVSNRLNRLPVDLVHQHSNLEEKLKSEDADMVCPLLSTLKKDFLNNGPVCPIRIAKSDRIYLNQMEMSFTQFGFFGLMLIYPEKFAAKNATDEELANFVHLWRFIGYMLGIKDEYNICRGELDEVKQRSRHIIEYCLKPMLLRVNKEWEHMGRSALQGIEKFTKMRINFESTVLYLCWVFGIEMPYLLQYVGWKELMMFNLTKLVMTESHKIPGFGRFLNYAIKRNIENEAKKQDKSEDGEKK